MWEGRDCPSVRKVQEFLDMDIRSGALSPSSQVVLTGYAIQAVLHCPVKALPGLLNALACAFFRNEQGMIDTKKLFTIKLANKRSMCGRPIKKGDILWICKQCGQDNTCVQCDDCFQLSDHESHEVYFHRSSEGGGCCDCGDTEAWLESGTCRKHGLDPEAQGVDPLSVLPTSLVLGLTAVLHGSLLVLQQLIVASVNGFNCPASNPFTQPHPTLPNHPDCEEEVVVRIHNDDIHSYMEVTSGLQKCGLSGRNAAQLTETVDKEGSTEVCHTTLFKKVQSCWEALGASPLNLCVCILPSRLAEVEASLPILLSTWLQPLATSNDGLMRLVCNTLMMPMDDLLQASTGTVSGPSSGGASQFIDLSSLFLSPAASGATRDTCRSAETPLSPLKTTRPLPLPARVPALAAVPVPV